MTVTKIGNKHLLAEEFPEDASVEWRTYLRCVECFSALEVYVDGLKCAGCRRLYKVLRGAPILLRENHTLFPPSAYEASDGPEVSKGPEGGKWAKIFPSNSVNLAGDRVLDRLAGELRARSASLVLVVGGGRQRGRLNSKFMPLGKLAVIYADVDVNADVDFFCDAHEIPLSDNCVDAVVTTAVLEHVMYPEKVASEIARVLKKNGGLLYSELPFMQQVHEGAYDFTRYTLSGHRRLMNQFHEIEAGMVAGPGTALAWSIEYFLLSFVGGGRARMGVKALARLGTFWLKWFDKILAKRPAAMDAASCTYFYGEIIGEHTQDAEIVEAYVGGQTLSHL
jgi:SAM-dependent methyltransferase